MPSDQPAAKAQRSWTKAAPAAFVLLWSTGFIGAKLGLPYAEPMTFLALRFAVASGLLLAIVLVWRAPWPRSWAQAAHIAVAGLLLHGLYLGSIFAAIHLGVEAGVAALVVSLQPLLVAAVAARLLGERTTRRQWLGLAIGILGVALVVGRKLGLGLGTVPGMGLVVLGLFGLAAATLYQKRFCDKMPFRSGNVIQLAAASLVTGALALLFETRVVVWSGEFVFALAWLILVLSLGAFMLLYLLIQRGAAARVASLFYLVPPSTAVIAWLLFGESFGPLALAGMALTVIGVALANRTG